MLNANEAKKIVEEIKASKAKALTEKAAKWCEENASLDIEAAAKKGESSIAYRLSNTVFTADYREAVASVLMEAGYTVKMFDGQGCIDMTIEW